MKSFYTILDSIDQDGPVDPDVVNYCERFLEFITDLEVRKSEKSICVYHIMCTSMPTHTHTMYVFVYCTLFLGSAPNAKVLQHTPG